MRNALARIVTAAALVGSATFAQADFVNQGFETGDLTGWGVFGDGSADVISTTPNAASPGSLGSDNWGGSPGDSGSFMALLNNGSGIEVINQAASPTSTPLFLWLNFITNEVPGTFNDFVTATWTDTIGVHSASLSVNSDTSIMAGHDLRTSGWRSFLLDAGTSSLSVSVANAGDTAVNSYSLVDITTVIPEPETYALMLAGLGLLGFLARRRRNSLNIA